MYNVDMLSKPEMIIFDYGGTILYEPDFDFLRGEREVFKHVIKNPHNVTPEQVCNFNERIYSESNAARKVEFELHHNQMLKMKYEYFGIELDVSLEEAEWILWQGVSPATEKCRMAHITELLAYLKEKNIRTGVISNMGWSGNNLKRRINTILPDNNFEFIIATSEYGYRKPNPLIFELALNKAGLSADKVWYCGDTFSNDCEGAHRAGIYPVYYTGQPDGKRKDGPVRTILDYQPDFQFTQICDWNELKERLK